MRVAAVDFKIVAGCGFASEVKKAGLECGHGLAGVDLDEVLRSRGRGSTPCRRKRLRFYRN